MITVKALICGHLTCTCAHRQSLLGPTQWECGSIHWNYDSATMGLRESGWDILQTKFTNTFSPMWKFEFLLNFSGLFLRAQFTKVSIHILAWRRIHDKPLFDPGLTNSKIWRHMATVSWYNINIEKQQPQILNHHKRYSFWIVLMFTLNTYILQWFITPR